MIVPRPAQAREPLPNRRGAETFVFEVCGFHYCATVSRYSDGRIGEIFVDSHKAGPQSDANAADAAVLQRGCTPYVLRAALLRDLRINAGTPLGRAIDLVAEREGSKVNAETAR